MNKSSVFIFAFALCVALESFCDLKTADKELKNDTRTNSDEFIAERKKILDAFMAEVSKYFSWYKAGKDDQGQSYYISSYIKDRNKAMLYYNDKLQALAKSKFGKAVSSAQGILEAQTGGQSGSQFNQGSGGTFDKYSDKVNKQYGQSVEKLNSVAGKKVSEKSSSGTSRYEVKSMTSSPSDPSPPQVRNYRYIVTESFNPLSRLADMSSSPPVLQGFSGDSAIGKDGVTGAMFFSMDGYVCGYSSKADETVEVQITPSPQSNPFSPDSQLTIKGVKPVDGYFMVPFFTTQPSNYQTYLYSVDEEGEADNLIGYMGISLPGEQPKGDNVQTAIGNIKNESKKFEAEFNGNAKAKLSDFEAKAKNILAQYNSGILETAGAVDAFGALVNDFLGGTVEDYFNAVNGFEESGNNILDQLYQLEQKYWSLTNFSPDGTGVVGSFNKKLPKALSKILSKPQSHIKKIAKTATAKKQAVAGRINPSCDIYPQAVPKYLGGKARLTNPGLWLVSAWGFCVAENSTSGSIRVYGYLDKNLPLPQVILVDASGTKIAEKTATAQASATNTQNLWQVSFDEIPVGYYYVSAYSGSLYTQMTDIIVPGARLK